VDFTVVTFRPYRPSGSRQTLIDKWEFDRGKEALATQRAWKNTGSPPDLASSGGHEVYFENSKVFPFNLILKHFPLRSPKQARRKIFRDRGKRAAKERRSLGFHTHYASFRIWHRFLWGEHRLLAWDENIAVEYMPEMTTRAGIRQSE
jgi:hypothetical protein